jgi:hypothetical protein
MKIITLIIKVNPPTGETFQDLMHLIDYLHVNGYEFTIQSDELLGPADSKPQLNASPKGLLT